MKIIVNQKFFVFTIVAFLFTSCNGNKNTFQNRVDSLTENSVNSSILLGKWISLEKDETFEFKESEYFHYWQNSLTGNEKYKISDAPLSDEEYDKFVSLKKGKIINPKGKFSISYFITNDTLTIVRGLDETQTKFTRQ